MVGQSRRRKSRLTSLSLYRLATARFAGAALGPPPDPAEGQLLGRLNKQPYDWTTLLEVQICNLYVCTFEVMHTGWLLLLGCPARKNTPLLSSSPVCLPQICTLELVPYQIIMFSRASTSQKKQSYVHVRFEMA